MRLEGMKALVTGAGRGIGKGIALALAREGADIVVHYNRSAQTAEELAHEIESLGRQAVPMQADMGNIPEVRRLIANGHDELGGLDILVNNAAITANHDFFDISEEDWDLLFDVNLKGLFFASQEAARLMQEQNRGRIIHIGSVHSTSSRNGFTVYAATKGGLDSLTGQMALELAPHGVTVNTIAPGLIEVEKYHDNPRYDRSFAASRIPLRRVGFPEDVAGAVVFLASEESGFVTGQVLAVDGGQLSLLAIKRNPENDDFFD